MPSNTATAPPPDRLADYSTAYGRALELVLEGTGSGIPPGLRRQVETWLYPSRCPIVAQASEDVFAGRPPGGGPAGEGGA